MRGLVASLMVTLSLTSVAYAHEHWVDLEDFYPQEGSSAKVFICSGHYYPKSSFALSERLLHEFAIISPAKDKETITTREEKDEKRHIGEVSFRNAGTYIISFILKKPQMAEPLYQARAIATVEKEEDVSMYQTGIGLEIVPQALISSLKKGGELALVVFYNGKRIASSINVMAENGKSSILRASEKKPIVLNINKAGRYLLTCSYEGKGCSLTFFIKSRNEVESEK